MKKHTRTFALVFSTIMIVGLAGCSEGARRAALSDAEAVDFAFASIEARTAHGDSAFYTRTLAEHLPNQRISLEGRDPVLTGAGIVIGEVTDAKEVAAYRLGTDEAGEELPAGTTVPVGSDEADWRDIEVTLNVTRAWSRDVEAGSAIHLTMSLSDPSKTEEFVQGLQSMSRVVAVLDVGPVNGSYKLVRGGATLGLVSDDDAFTFPAMDAEEEAEWLEGSGTVDLLDSASRSDPRVIEVRGAVRTN